jgi:uncharacterized membrane protein
MRRPRRLQFTAAVIFVAAYAGLSHYSNSVAATHDLGVVLAVAPVLTLSLALVWRWSRPWVAVLLAAASGVLLRLFWPLLERNFTDVYLLQEGGFYTLMAASFGQSLRRGRVALCTHIADQVHGPLNAREVTYTRRVTAAWAIFFVVIAGVTLALFEFAPLRVWSFFANFCVIPLVGLMFAAEYAVRRHALPHQRRGILEAVRVYFASPG